VLRAVCVALSGNDASLPGNVALPGTVVGNDVSYICGLPPAVAAPAVALLQRLQAAASMAG
jgi:hypothetical protein